MEIGAFNRASNAAAYQPAARQEPATSGIKPVETQLVSDKAVTAVSRTLEVARETAVTVGISREASDAARRQQALRDTITKHLDINPATRDVVVKSVRKETGEVIKQYPDEVVLKLREFAAQMRDQAMEEALTRRIGGDKVNAKA
jgi:uncharacterized FlaG/YvyC family protein